MARVMLNGHLVTYEIKGSGPPVLFIHGLGADRQQSVDALGPADGVTLIAPDLPGHGDTWRDCLEEGPFSFARYAKVVCDLLEHLEVRRAVVGGTSMGAGVALAVALRSPEVVAGLFLVRPAWLDGPARPHLDIVARVFSQIASSGTAEAARLIERLPEIQSWRADIPGLAASILGLAKQTHAASTATHLALLVEDYPIGSLSELQTIRCPAWVLGNAADPLHPEQLAETLAAAFPEGRYVHLPPRYLEPTAFREALVAQFNMFRRVLGPKFDMIGDQS